MQDDRADVLMAVHTCLLTHFATASATGAGHERSPQSDRNGTATSRSSSAAASSDALHAQADIAAAHSAAVKVRIITRHVRLYGRHIAQLRYDSRWQCTLVCSLTTWAPRC